MRPTTPTWIFFSSYVHVNFTPTKHYCIQGFTIHSAPFTTSIFFLNENSVIRFSMIRRHRKYSEYYSSPYWWNFRIKLDKHVLLEVEEAQVANLIKKKWNRRPPQARSPSICGLKSMSFLFLVFCIEKYGKVHFCLFTTLEMVGFVQGAYFGN